MRVLAKYSFANAKIRAMLSRIPDAHFFQRLLDADSFEEARTLVRSFYIPDLSESRKEISDPKQIERQLLMHDIVQHTICRDILIGKREKNFISLLMEQYEIQELQAALRTLLRKEPSLSREFLPRIIHSIPYEEIATAASLETVSALLAHTPYAEALSEKTIHDIHAAFMIDFELDSGYYRRLIAAAKNLTRLDRRIVLDIIGIEIDIANILLLLKGERYYPFSSRQLAQWVLPGGRTFFQKNVAAAKEFKDILAPLLHYKKITLSPDTIRGNPDLLVQALEEELAEKVRAVLRGFPFTIGTVIGYLFLQQRATQRIISLLYAKYFHWKREAFLSFIPSC
ncbi:MAG: V-type ATPase subunit [Candidatus Ratteibacteria bacterium]|jgi:vacuolar-type H+-ATPase subunit C/Vma6